MTEFKYLNDDFDGSAPPTVEHGKILVNLEIAYQLKRIADNTEGLIN